VGDAKLPSKRIALFTTYKTQETARNASNRIGRATLRNPSLRPPLPQGRESRITKSPSSETRSSGCTSNAGESSKKSGPTCARTPPGRKIQPLATHTKIAQNTKCKRPTVLYTRLTYSLRRTPEQIFAPGQRTLAKVETEFESAHMRARAG